MERGAKPDLSSLHVDVGLAGIFTLIVCEAHRHENHASTRGVWGHAARKF